MPRPDYPARPGSQMFDPNWQPYHRPTAELQMTATCTIRRPPSAAEAVFDEVSGRSVFPPPTVVYEGPCRIQGSNRLAGVRIVGDRDVVLGRYAVAVAAEATGIAVGDEVANIVDDANPDLAGRSIWVIDVPAGTLTWQQDLVCADTPRVDR
jgi:hypothetical protein